MGISPSTKLTENYRYIGTITLIDIAIFKQREENKFLNITKM